MAQSQAVVLYQGPNDEDFTVIGPFTSGDEACTWGFREFGRQSTTVWYWLPLNTPAMHAGWTVIL